MLQYKPADAALISTATYYEHQYGVAAPAVTVSDVCLAILSADIYAASQYKSQEERNSPVAPGRITSFRQFMPLELKQHTHTHNLQKYQCI
jgi:hypothetical protein